MKIAAVIPAYNEGMKIAGVVRDVLNYADIAIVIDDGSDDNTYNDAKEAGALTIHQENTGIAGAVKQGFKEAIKQKADIAVIIAGDGQHEGRHIPKLIKPIIDKEVDVILTSRFRGNLSEMPFQRILGNKIYTGLIRLLTGMKLTDALCGQRAFSKKALEKIDLKRAKGYELEVVTLFEIHKKGLKYKELPIKAIYKGSVSKMEVKHMLSIMGWIIKEWWSL